jgi:hypothetical protein
MKKHIVYLFLAVATFSAIDSKASVTDSSILPTGFQSAFIVDKAKTDKQDALLLRLLEIKNMDKSNLTSIQKKLLRKEVKAIGKEKVHGGGGIYMSLSAIVIMLLLLIILL